MRTGQGVHQIVSALSVLKDIEEKNAEMPCAVSVLKSVVKLTLLIRHNASSLLGMATGC